MDQDMYNTKKITVIGGTGNLGAPVVKNLLASGLLVEAIVRNIDKAKKIFGSHPNINFSYADLEDKGSLKKALANTSYLYLNLSANNTRIDVPFAPEREGIANILSAVNRTKIKQIILISGLGALDKIKEPERKGSVPNIIRKQGHKLIKESGIPYTILHCSWFIDCFPIYLRKNIYTVIGNNKAPIYFTNCYDYTLNIIKAIDNEDALFKEFPIQGNTGMIHSEAAKEFFSIFSPSSKTSLLPRTVLKVISCFSKNLKFVHQLSEYSFQFPETFLAKDYGTYKVLGRPSMSIMDYAEKLRNENTYEYLER